LPNPTIAHPNFLPGGSGTRISCAIALFSREAERLLTARPCPTLLRKFRRERSFSDMAAPVRGIVSGIVREVNNLLRSGEELADLRPVLLHHPLRLQVSTARQKLQPGSGLLCETIDHSPRDVWIVFCVEHHDLLWFHLADMMHWIEKLSPAQFV